MLAQMSWSQYVAWTIYARMEPFGEERDDLRAGIIASTIANANRDSRRKPDPFKASDFMPKFGDATHGNTTRPITTKRQWADIKRTAKSYAAGGAFSKQYVDE